MAKDDIQTLIDSLKRGQYEDATEKIGLLSAALQEKRAEVPLLLTLLRAPQIPLRLAALDAVRLATNDSARVMTRAQMTAGFNFEGQRIPLALQASRPSAATSC